jgi:predicted acylesterase/phospholipase RssA
MNKLLVLLVGITYAYSSAVAWLTWGLRGYILVTCEIVLVVGVVAFLVELLRDADARLAALVVSCCALVATLVLVSDGAASDMIDRAKTDWWMTLLVLVVSSLGSGALVGAWLWLKPMNSDRRALVFASLCVLLLGYFWFWHVGSHDILLDLIVVAFTYSVLAFFMHLAGRGLAGERLFRNATFLLLTGAFFSWLGFSAVDRFVVTRSIPTDPERFERLAKGDGWPDVRVGLALSGGGYRAALVHAGVLSALEAMHVRVRNLVTVSGGSIFGSFYAAGGEPKAFADAVGTRSFNLLREMLHAENLVRLLPGLELLDRTDIQANMVDRILPHGLRADVMIRPEQPRLIMGATDMKSGLIVGLSGEGILMRDLPSICDKQDCVEAFSAVMESSPWFTPRAEGKFPEDDRTMADLVATSGAFPIAFPPRRIVVRQRVPDLNDRSSLITVDRPLVLSDGGLSDNFGVRLLLDARYLARDNAAWGPHDDIFTQPQATALMDPDWKVDLILVSDGGQQLQDSERVGDWDLTRVLDVVSESAGAPPVKSWAQLQLTDRTLTALENDRVPASVVQKLRTLDANYTSFHSEQSFLDAMRAKLTPEELDEFRTKLLYHARHSRTAPPPDILLLSPARFTIRNGSPMMREFDVSRSSGSCSSPLHPFALPFPDLKTMTQDERKYLVGLWPASVAPSVNIDDFPRLVEEQTKQRAKDAQAAAMGAPTLAPSEPSYQTDADRLADRVFNELYPRLLRLTCIFAGTSTLKDQYSEGEAAALFLFGQYLTILRWPEIKSALDRADDRKRSGYDHGD